MSSDSAGSVADINIAFLRGINVGGRNRLPMRDLTAMVVDAGCSNVRTYIQSGNVLYQPGTALGDDIPSAISSSILSRFGYRIPVIARTAQELREIVRANPFVKSGADTDKLHVVFLAEQPDTPRVEALDSNRSPGDEFTVLGREVHLYCPDGLARTRLTNSYFDSALSTISTVRNWRTVLRLLDMVEEIG